MRLVIVSGQLPRWFSHAIDTKTTNHPFPCKSQSSHRPLATCRQLPASSRNNSRLKKKEKKKQENKRKPRQKTRKDLQNTPNNPPPPPLPFPPSLHPLHGPPQPL